MPVVSSWDWINRRIYLGVANYDPIDIYREHRGLRETDESVRQYAPMVRAIGGQPKGGGRRFGNALQMISDTTFPILPGLVMAKIIPLDSSGINIMSGEVVTDNPDVDSDPFDTASLTNPPRIQEQPKSEIATVNVGSAVTQEDKDEIVNAVLAGEINANIKKVNDLLVSGSGTTNDPWGPQ